ncbi:MAG TPA: multiheme c-type cytochrome [Candidatus Saccharimonadales bacterium]|nr:multiheme c-type cytochrome [Candidatus Saccharimonadales bacterium]
MTGITTRADQWSRPFTGLAIAWLAFETLSGLSIYLLPFSVPIEWMVIIHTGIGLLLLAPATAYQIWHFLSYRKRTATANVILGYLASAAALAASVTGLVLTLEAILGRRISYGWDLAHVVSAFALVAFLVPHLVIVIVRDRALGFLGGTATLLKAQRGALLRALGGLAAMAAAVGLAWSIYPGDRFVNEFPDGYTHPYGADRPFAPSLARTSTGGAFDPASLSGSESCGTSGCHEQIVREWSVSAHRWSAMDLAFQRIQTEMAKQNGPESTRYCGGCHDPISLFSGTKNIFTEDLTGLAGYKEGVSCLTCHSIRKTDIEGNANYVVAQPVRYLFELRNGPGSRFMRDFLIRAYPWEHVATLSKRLFKTPEYCAACHKQFVDKEVNNVGWVQLQNQFDNWRKSRWNHPGDAKKTIECRECHMPLMASTDPAAGDPYDYNRTADDGRHRSHRFVGANQFMPGLLKLPGADEQVALTNKWLRGEYPIPEIADKWTHGPAVGIDLQVPEEATPGADVPVKVVITSNKVGHDFPTGPLDIIQAWVEVTVKDDTGATVFKSGTVDNRRFIQPGSFMFKAEPVDQYGNLIDRHNLWEMVGVRYRRALFPGFSDTAEFAFKCPGTAGGAAEPPTFEKAVNFKAPEGVKGPLRVEARLLYRKTDQYLLNFMFGEQKGLTAPITEMAAKEASIGLSDAPPVVASARPAGAAASHAGR